MCPSVLNASAGECRRRWRRALLREYAALATEWLAGTPARLIRWLSGSASRQRNAKPKGARLARAVIEDLLALVTCALGFIALATIAMML